MLFVGAASIAQPNTSAVGQVGISNDGIVNQNGNDNHSKIGQDGNDNSSTVDQGFLPSVYPALGNIGEAKQTGNNNTAFISQSNIDNEAYQIQEGDRNSATIWQDQVAGNIAGNTGDKAWQTQTGDDNTATIDQGTTGNAFPVGPPTGVFTAEQISEFAGIPIPFVPNGGNEATQTQNGDFSIAYASQGGTGNSSTQTQNSTAASTLERNVSRHFQYGADNTALTLQNGIRNNEHTLQIGENNYSQVTQTNLVGGAGNVHVGFSSGSWNNIVVNQTNP